LVDGYVLHIANGIASVLMKNMFARRKKDDSRPNSEVSDAE
jgi:hypothetical protein